ncbi:dihydrolipoyl dehydrogenase [Dongia rigui]|uniref:Dihydrolipoyl dehydrogenase n=1 Tax=Dongia rigui TaxID=940149 RepID=A0ABU5DZC9_9PROT|nr:dihydrolipoyl dehydrogenase [Dongia rigui]MDY0871906.1 dihydrolipoyl dehydrogenase [Dongia rigui]
MAEEAFDLVVIGGGPGGYVCAIKAAQLGLKVACVEKRGALGGTCLNVGCIPSKALLASSEKFEEAGHHLALHGIKVDKVALDLPTMMGRKDKVVGELTKGIEFLFKKNKVTYLKGAGALLGGGKVQVTGEANQTVSAKSIVIATGSDSTPLPGLTIDEKKIVTSTGALALEKVPEHMVVIGGGVIGLELGSVWRRLGAKVTVIEFLERIIPTTDGEIATQFQKILTKQGIEFRLGQKVTGAKTKGAKIDLSVEPATGGAAETVTADVVLVSVGRRPYTEGLGLEKAGVKLDERGRVAVDRHFQTNVPGIYAIGDVIVGPMLAHKAEEEGVALAEQLAGQKGHVNYDTCPSIVYTAPELASVGKTEEELKAAGIEYKVGKFPFSVNSRAKAAGDTDGQVKLLADAKTDRLLGAHIVGPGAGTLIHECVMAMEFQGSAEDVARAFHGHPTHNEAIKEAAMAVGGKPIHM